MQLDTSHESFAWYLAFPKMLLIILAQNLNKLYVGLCMLVTVGVIGISGLWILGNPYI